MKRIAIFINTLETGGAEKQSLILADALSQLYIVTIIVWSPSNSKLYNYYKENKNFSFALLNGSFIQKLTSFKALIKKEDFDIIFSYLALTNTLTAFMGKILRVRFCVGGIRLATIKPFKLLVQRFLHNNLFDFSISNSHSGLNFAKNNNFNASKLLVIPNGIEFKNPIQRQTNPNDITIITVARFVDFKDYFTAINSIDYLINNLCKNVLCKINYTIVGYGILEKSIRQYIESKGLNNIIKLVIDPEDIEPYFRNSDIFLLTSIHEGTSNSVMEALSFSLPAVVTDAGDNEYLVKNGFNGYVSKPKDFKSIASCLHDLIESPDKRKTFGLNSHKHLYENYSINNLKKKYVDFIESKCQ